MAIKFGHTIGTLIAQRNLAESGRALGQTFERLSSGLRINHAGDDPADLAVASALQTQARLSTQALRNVNDGISMLSVADSALQALQSVVARQQELAQQAANGLYTSAQRRAMNNEANALVDEFNRIIASSEFNGRSLFDRSNITLQAGAGSSNTVTFALGEELSRTVGSGDFSAGAAFGTGATPVSVVVGDLNGDGTDDLVTANSTANSLSILLGNGNGTFKARTDLSTGAASAPTAVTLADMDGDGDLDILSANYSSNRVSLFRSNGDGTFQAAVSMAAGSGPAYIVTGDFNGDGTMDFASAAALDDKVKVFLGNGNGTYFTKSSPSTGVNPVWMSASDFNGDGILDLATADYNAGSGIDILIGNGDGTFQGKRSIVTAVTPRTVTAADFNHDGVMDLAAAGGGNQINIFTGQGDGSFTVSSNFTIGLTPSSLTAADMNGDGIPDLVLNEWTSNTFSVCEGRGDGSFEPRSSFATPTNPRAVAVGDFNGDGVPDVVTANQGTHNASIFVSGVTQVASEPYLDLATSAGAREAIETLAAMQQHISAELGVVGANQSRLTYTLNNISVMRENFAAAAARITDADIAQEAADMLRLQILQQAAAAVLAQANTESELVLRLLS